MLYTKLTQIVMYIVHLGLSHVCTLPMYGYTCIVCLNECLLKKRTKLSYSLSLCLCSDTFSVQLLHKLSIHADDGPIKLMKVQSVHLCTSPVVYQLTSRPLTMSGIQAIVHEIINV